MFRILAVEPHPERGTALQRLVHDHVDADVVLTTSAKAAISAMSEQVPDLILTSALMSPSDELQLTEHLKQFDEAQHLPILTIPPIVELDDPRRTRSGRLLPFFRSRPSTPWPFDPQALGARIQDALEQLPATRTSSRIRFPHSPAIHAPDDARSLPDTNTDDMWSSALAVTDDDLLNWCGLGVKRLRAHRWSRAELPWLSGIKLPWGDARLLNVSTSGLLIESGSKLMPGSSAVFHLWGLNKNLMVPARIVRSEVGAVDPSGVKYRAAAAFEREVDLLVPRRAQHVSAGSAKGLAELLVQVMDERERGADPVVVRASFEQGLRRFVAACQIEIRDVPDLANEGGASVWFTVPSGLGCRTILQATFDPNYTPHEEELRILKAAATMAAVILQFEGSSERCSPATPSAAGVVNAW